MKKRIGIILLMIVCMMSGGGSVSQAAGIIGSITSDPNATVDDPNYVRVVVVRTSSSNASGGSFQICNGSCAGIMPSLLYNVIYYFIRRDIYRVSDLSMTCKRITCNGKEVTDGCAIDLTAGGYIVFETD